MVRGEKGHHPGRSSPIRFVAGRDRTGGARWWPLPEAAGFGLALRERTGWGDHRDGKYREVPLPQHTGVRIHPPFRSLTGHPSSQRATRQEKRLIDGVSAEMTSDRKRKAGSVLYLLLASRLSLDRHGFMTQGQGYEVRVLHLRRGGMGGEWLVPCFGREGGHHQSKLRRHLMNPDQPLTKHRAKVTWSQRPSIPHLYPCEGRRPQGTGTRSVRGSCMPSHARGRVHPYTEVCVCACSCMERERRGGPPLLALPCFSMSTCCGMRVCSRR
jgi:hypothetical protein